MNWKNRDMKNLKAEKYDWRSWCVAFAVWVMYVFLESWVLLR